MGRPTRPPPAKKSKTLLVIRDFMLRKQTVDLGVKQFSLCRYKMLSISAICAAVSWLVYIGLLFLFSFLDGRNETP